MALGGLAGQLRGVADGLLSGLRGVPRSLVGVTLGLGGRYVSEQIGSYPFTLPSYFVADASVSYVGENYRVTAGVKNVFNKAYYDGAINANVVSPSLPRNFNLGVTYFF